MDSRHEPVLRRLAPGSSDFRCRMSAAHWDGALLIETDVSAQRYEHTVRHAKNGGWDQIAFQMYRRGSYRGIYGETEVDVASGDISVIDLGKPYVKESTDEADLNLIVPRSTVERHLPALRHGMVLMRSAPLARLAQIHLEGLLSCMDQIEAPAAHHAIDAFLILLSGTGLTDDVPAARPFLRATARRCAEDVIRHRLGKGEIDIAALARACGVSRATLYHLFADDGGVHAFVQAERLALAWRLVQELPGVPLQDIADRCGFHDAAGFSRAFRRAFDASPSAARGQAIPVDAPSLDTPCKWIDSVTRLRGPGEA
ncbi:AraC family transcriptional regulator [uncultured Aureimonas sp.]|uniref:AraC family transcriptional regulator n=1 Tax=uncultured Aureimonas sp. TaxID=1604662 RepID=UPI0025F08B07|nr:AraC family transcriptional regulator [uncultured Aureimonas sp.]